jgi:hypothetical protein
MAAQHVDIKSNNLLEERIEKHQTRGVNRFYEN